VTTEEEEIQRVADGWRRWRNSRRESEEARDEEDAQALASETHEDEEAGAE
jgi:hypothetical protein